MRTKRVCIVCKDPTKKVRADSKRCSRECFYTFMRARESAAVAKMFKPTYSTWSSVKARCYSPKHTAYLSYGAKGITMCDRWRESFFKFYTDMGPRPEGMSLDRIDGTGNYEPGNCRWATAKQQTRNRINTIMVNYKGTRMPLADVCELEGLPRGTIVGRLRAGWTDERALTQPIKQLTRLRGKE